MAGTPKLVILDLDGTLVDSLRDIGESVNECLGLLGLPEYPIDRYRYMVGEGVPTLCRRALDGAHPHYLNRLIELSRIRYRTRILVHTSPYPGITEMVSSVAKLGCTLAVLSNKPHAMTVRIVRAYWNESTFAFVQGYVHEEQRKPNPQHVFEMCQSLGITPGEVCLVGDTPTDVETAHNAGARAIAVTWGFRTRADLAAARAETIVDTPDEVLRELTG